METLQLHTDPGVHPPLQQPRGAGRSKGSQISAAKLGGCLLTISLVEKDSFWGDSKPQHTHTHRKPAVPGLGAVKCERPPPARRRLGVKTGGPGLPANSLGQSGHPSPAPGFLLRQVFRGAGPALQRKYFCTAGRSAAASCSRAHLTLKGPLASLGGGWGGGQGRAEPRVSPHTWPGLPSRPPPRARLFHGDRKAGPGSGHANGGYKYPPAGGSKDPAVSTSVETPANSAASLLSLPEPGQEGPRSSSHQTCPRKSNDGRLAAGAQRSSR